MSVTILFCALRFKACFSNGKWLLKLSTCTYTQDRAWLIGQQHMKTYYHNNPKFWDRQAEQQFRPKSDATESSVWSGSTLFETHPAVLTILYLKFKCPFYNLLISLKPVGLSGKQCRPWLDSTECGIWSGSTLFAQDCLSQYLGLLRYFLFVFTNYLV